MDLRAAADQVHIAVGIDTVALTVDDEPTAHHVEGVVQHALVQAVTVGRIDGIVGGDDGDVAAVDVDDCALQALVGLGHADGRSRAVGVADGEDMIGVDSVVARRNREAAAEQRHIVVAVDAVVDRVDVHGHAVEDQAGIIPGLDAVLGVAVDDQRAVAGHIHLGIGLCLERRAVKGVGHRFVRGVLVIGVFVVGECNGAGDDDLDLSLLVDRDGRAGGAGQIQIVQHKDHAGGAFLDGDIAVRAAAGDHIGTGGLDGDLAVVIGHGDIGRVGIVRFQRGGGVGHGAGHHLCGGVRGAQRGLRTGLLHLTGPLGRLLAVKAAGRHLGRLLAIEIVTGHFGRLLPVEAAGGHLQELLAVESIGRHRGSLCILDRRGFRVLCVFRRSGRSLVHGSDLIQETAIHHKIGRRVDAVGSLNTEMSVVNG